MKSFKFNKIELAGLFAAVLGLFSFGAAHGQTLYVSQYQSPAKLASFDATTGVVIANPLASVSVGNLYGIAVSGNTLYAPTQSSTIKTYNATTGALINSSFISGLGSTTSVAIYGNNLYVADTNTGYVHAYDATTGVALGGFTSFIAVNGGTLDMAVSGDGSILYVDSNNTIGTYNAATGAAIHSTFISGVNATSLAISGNNLFLAGATYPGAVAKYDATTGALITGSFVTGITTSFGENFLAISGNNLFVDGATSAIGEYNATTGAAINSNFITGLSGPTAMTVLGAVPEPSQTAMLVFGGFALLALRWRMRKTA